MCVAGDKAETLEKVLEGAHDLARLPPQIIEPVNGSVLWLVDTAAAGRLEE